MTHPILAILIMAISNFILGAFWYSPVMFVKAWQKESGTSCTGANQHGKTTFIYAFVYALLAAIGFYLLVHHSHSLIHDLEVGLVVGVLIVATSFGINYQFAGKSNKLFLIDAGYHVVQFLLYAVIFWLFKR